MTILREMLKIYLCAYFVQPIKSDMMLLMWIFLIVDGYERDFELAVLRL